MRKLTPAEIERFASRPGVRRMAVENFLLSNHRNATSFVALANLELDARLYRWNAATINAIRDGILLAEKKERE